MKWPFFIAAGLIVIALTSCAKPKIAINERADFTRISRVAVATFGGPSGDVAADLLTQDLLKHGADVVERSRLDAILQERDMAGQQLLDSATVKRVGKILGVDAIFVGTVATNLPRQNYLVMGSDGYNFNTVTPVPGNVSSVGMPVMGLPDSQILTSAAQASLIARMVDVETGSIMWSGRMSYEGLDTESTMAGITESFVKSLIPVWSGLK